MDHNPADLIATKQALRTTARAARTAMSPHERAAASAALCERLLTLHEFRRVRTVLLYASAGDEVDLAAAVTGLRERDVRTLFPRVHRDQLQLVNVTDLRNLQLGHRGIREPTGATVDPGVVDVAVVPGVAFDPHGGRLGQGGGHYDRLLPALASRARRVGVGFSCQMVPEVPREPHDVALDLVVTERAVYRTSAA